MADAIDTSKIIGRRQIHFDSLDDILAEVERLADAKEMRALGNNSAGQILRHLATAMNKSIDGFTHRPPAAVRFFLRVFLKRRILMRTMSAGFKLPAAAQSEMWGPAVDLASGLTSIRQAIARLRTETPRQPHPAFGPLLPDEWLQLHCRHAELHLSFLVPVD
jgi:Protein of unknown function (DUF1569)